MVTDKSMDGEATSRASLATVEDLFTAVRQRLPMVVLIVLIGVGATYAYLSSQAKSYTATATLVFDQNSETQQATADVTPISTDVQEQQQTNLDLILLGQTPQQTADRIGDGLTADSIKKAITASAPENSNLIQVSASARTPRRAALIANTYANLFVTDQTLSAQRSLLAEQSLVEHQLAALSAPERASAEGQTLQDRAQTLAQLAAAQTDNVELAESASVPGHPSFPRMKRSLLIAGFVALLVAVLLALAIERFDPRIRDAQDLERIYGFPLLASVPQAEELSRVDTDWNTGPAAVYHEIFRLLRAQLAYFNVGRSIRVVSVISAAPGDGKSTAAAFLARVASEAGLRVLLLEADLRRPTTRSRMDIRSAPGLGAVLVGEVSVDEAVQAVSFGGPSDVEDSAARFSLSVLPADDPPPVNPSRLLESPRMAELLTELREEFDYLVLDTPPLTVVPDAFPLIGLSDGVVVVGRVRRNNREMVRRLRSILVQTRAPVLGLVANGVPAGRKRKHGYQYGYDYASPATDAAVSGDLKLASKGR